MNLNEYNVIKIQVQAYPRPQIIQMNVGNAVIKPKIVDGKVDSDEYWIIYNFTMKAEYVGEKHHVRVTNEKGASNHYFKLKSHVIQVNLCQKFFFLQNMGRTCCVQKLFCGLVDAKIRASDKDLPVYNYIHFQGTAGLPTSQA